MKKCDAILRIENRKYWVRKYGTFLVYLRKCIISEIAQITSKRRKTNEIEDSIWTLMELVYEARTSYSQSLDQGTIFIDLIKIPVSFQHLSSPRIPRVLFFAKKTSSVSATWCANWLVVSEIWVTSYLVSRNSGRIALRGSYYRFFG